MARNSVGRPSKGARETISAKPPVPFATILKENATAEGLSYGEYMVKLAAVALGMLEFVPQPSRDRTNELVNFPEEASRSAAA
ncbi:hypothetical protein ACIPY5_19975 [Microbacterium sp. NPDC089698]|uniref:hypothetical protein n=1 Tax=Microbacterium sp. NPDC089698 TaxID=3364200 RepID=UPI0037F262C5